MEIHRYVDGCKRIEERERESKYGSLKDKIDDLFGKDLLVWADRDNHFECEVKPNDIQIRLKSGQQSGNLTINSCFITTDEAIGFSKWLIESIGIMEKAKAQ